MSRLSDPIVASHPVFRRPVAGAPASARLSLPQVTLCAVTSVNVRATVRALQTCLEQIAFAECHLFTDADIRPEHPEITVIPIDRIPSSAAYSHFLQQHVVDHISTSHCLVVQWDGHVIDARRWREEFLDCDYIGARWPQFGDGHGVGNGGFSLRSRRLMSLCREPGFRPEHPEDIAIGRTNRDWLEDKGMRFASQPLADAFSAERAGDVRSSFGYHGVFNMPRVIGVEAFWHLYRELDDLGTVRHDFTTILQEMGQGPGGFRRMARMLTDRFRHPSFRRNPGKQV